MIIDHIKHASLYYRLNDRIAMALQAVQSTEFLSAEPGRHELQGSDVFALVQHYNTKPPAFGKWEAHRRYIDLQYVVSGDEVIGQAHLGKMTVTEPYNEEKDVLFLSGQGNFFTVSAGTFVIFFQQDVHMPGLAVCAPAPVHKIVIKFRMD
jgi:YhcH/YjgK/YiaL family protein